MKKKAAIYISFLLSIFLVACNSIHYVSIETYSPAEVTFPANVGTVVVVNNAVTQPDISDHVCTVFGVSQPDTIKADSAVWDACMALGLAMNEQNYFNDVLLFHDTIRKDTNYLMDYKFTPAQINSICRLACADAVISIDRLWFRVQRNVVSRPEGYVVGDINIQVNGTVRSYLPNRPTPLATIHLNDSVCWEQDADNLTILNLVIPKGEEALREAGKYIVAKAYTNFVPHWVQASRWFYNTAGSRWKEAAVFAANDKWENAAVRWEYFFANEKSRIKRAKAAVNMALASEIKGEFELSLDWANKGLVLFKEAGADKNEKNIRLTELYVNILMERIRENRKLNMQLGEE